VVAFSKALLNKARFSCVFIIQFYLKGLYVHSVHFPFNHPSIANVYWNHRMFLATGDAKYADVLERALYNGVISGVSLSGDQKLSSK
jgi:hypothetical protein